jgi:trimeric autotransporter adhesin
VEAPIIALYGGNVGVVSSDDALNATKGNGGESNDGSMLTFGGSTVTLSSTAGDPIDSNGSAVMTGGIVIVHGPQSQPEVAIDVNGTFNISGGMLIASGPNSGNMIEGTSTSSSQYAVLIKIISNVSAGTLFNIQNSSGTSLVTFAPVRNAYYFVFSSSGLLSGSAYKVYTGGSCSGATVTNGLHTGGTYSGGTQKGSFTVSGKLTTVSL